jgi:hypothetical protein
VALDGGTIASIAFGGAITAVTSVGTIAVKEWVDRRRERRNADADLKAAARRAWARIAPGSLYFGICEFYGQWGLHGADSIATALPDDDARILSGDADLWCSVQNALMSYALALDARAMSEDRAVSDQARAAVRAAILAGRDATARLTALSGFEPQSSDDALDRLFNDDEWLHFEGHEPDPAAP